MDIRALAIQVNTTLVQQAALIAAQSESITVNAADIAIVNSNITSLKALLVTAQATADLGEFVLYLTDLICMYVCMCLSDSFLFSVLSSPLLLCVFS